MPPKVTEPTAHAPRRGAMATLARLLDDTELPRSGPATRRHDLPFQRSITLALAFAVGQTAPTAQVRPLGAIAMPLRYSYTAPDPGGRAVGPRPIAKAATGTARSTAAANSATWVLRRCRTRPTQHDQRVRDQTQAPNC